MGFHASAAWLRWRRESASWFGLGLIILPTFILGLFSEARPCAYPAHVPACAQAYPKASGCRPQSGLRALLGVHAPGQLVFRDELVLHRQGRWATTACHTLTKVGAIQRQRERRLGWLGSVLEVLQEAPTVSGSSISRHQSALFSKLPCCFVYKTWHIPSLMHLDSLVVSCVQEVCGCRASDR